MYVRIQIASTSILSESSCAGFWLVVVAGGVVSCSFGAVGSALVTSAFLSITVDQGPSAVDGRDSGLESWSGLEKLSDGVECCEDDAAGFSDGIVAEPVSGVIGSMESEGAGTKG